MENMKVLANRGPSGEPMATPPPVRKVYHQVKRAGL